ncbi:resolvase (plasmid) [Persicobacter psychrovividus]|uniref:Resolvase n=2 Tax=Persicobacter psychrovividus TaxID=387638 RepID=A0ABM7VN28_9BACT|nr:resolvase [Persicobacter psychrovividus]
MLTAQKMNRTIAYIRTSTQQQEVDNQKLQLLEYANQQKLNIDEFLSIQISSRKTTVQRRIDELIQKLEPLDTLIVTEISRLGRSTSEVIQLINSLLEKGIRLIAIKQGLDLRQHDMNSKITVTLFSLLAELERDLISIRTKEALAIKKQQGIRLGKPKGTLQKSKFDKDLDQIKELLTLGVSIRKIARILGYTNPTGIARYIKTRQLMAQIKPKY